MKKFTTIGAALLLGGLSFSAMAQDSFPIPEVSPENGSVLASWEVWDTSVYWSENIEPVNNENQYAVIYYNGIEVGRAILGDTFDFRYEEIEDEDGYTMAPYGNEIIITWLRFTADSNSQTKAGKYTLTIPAGMYRVYGTEILNDDININYTVNATVNWNDDEASPRPSFDGNTYRSSQLSEVVIPFRTNSNLLPANTNQEVTATLRDPNPSNPEIPEVYPDDPGIAWSLKASGDVQYGEPIVIDPKLIKLVGNAIVLDLSELSDGIWDIFIPSDYAKINDYTFTGSVDTYYEVFNGMPDPIVTPADGSVLYGSPVNAVFAWLDNEGVKPVIADAPLMVTLAIGSYETQIEATYTSEGLVVDWADYAKDTNGKIIAGEYTITVPQNIVADEEGEPNVKCSVTYTLYAASAWTEIDPTPFEGPVTASELGAVTVTFKDELKAIANPPAVKVLLQSNDEDNDFGQGDDSGVMPLAEGEPVNNGVLDPSYVKVEGKNIILDLSFLENGAWYIEIPAGYAQVNATTFTEKVEINYLVSDNHMYAEVIGGLNSLYYTSEQLPQYATVTWSYSPLVLTGEGTITLQTADGPIDVKAEDVKLVHANAPVFGDDEPNASDDEGTEIIPDDDETLNALDILNLDSYLEGVTGQVDLVIPEGFVLVNGRANDEFSVNVEIYPIFEGEAAFMLEAETGVVEVTWPGYLASVFNFAQHPAYLTDAKGNNQELSYSNAAADDADITEIKSEGESLGLAVNLASLKLADGAYTLWIPSTYVVISSLDFEENWLNGTEYWQFEVKDGAIVGESTGINGIDNVKTVEGVYNLQGVKMSNDLNTLAPGLYIINGKKVLIRK